MDREIRHRHRAMTDKDRLWREWDLNGVPNPSYILHATALRSNLEVIDRVRREAGVCIITALKANATWAVFPLIRQYCDGATASSLSEARLVYEEMGVKAHTYAPVYTDEEIDGIIECSSHITFNSLSQYARHGMKARKEGISCGLRVNPEHSTVETALYDPSSPQSRLGIRSADLPVLPDGIEGLHFHSLCESRPSDLRQTLAALEERFGHLLPKVKWLNMGGGHLMTHVDYDEDELISILRDFRSRHPHLKVILEPGSAFTWDTGVLLSRVEDIVCNGGRRTMMLNVSFACHMPDCLEMPYQPEIIGMHKSADGEEGWYMGGNSCLAGDTYGAWNFDDEDHQPSVGDNVVFRDMIHYTMVKTTMFNGVSHPSIIIYDPATGYSKVREFGYMDYKQRMGALP